jgi:hypothetical protein
MKYDATGLLPFYTDPALAKAHATFQGVMKAVYWKRKDDTA